jgi:hypothetical protein
VDDDAGVTEIALDGGRHRLDLRSVRHVASVSPGARQLLFERVEPFLVPGEHGDAIAALGKSPCKYRSRAGSDTRDQANWGGHAINPPR